MLRKVNVLITGPPGCGKSTLITNIVKSLRMHNFKVGGITTPEIRSTTGRRTGFLIRDIASGEEQTMAAVSLSSKVRVGRYGVDVAAVREIGVAAIDWAVALADVVVIDEIGKMELAVPEFQQCVLSAFDSTKPVLGTIGLHLTSAFGATIKHRPDVTILRLTKGQQEAVHQRLAELLSLPSL